MQTGQDLTQVEQESSIVPLALVEMIERLSLKEKYTLVSLLDWDTLLQLRGESIAQTRRVGDPRIYVGTTASGLSLELPLEHVPAFLSALPSLLAVQHVEILVQNGQGTREYHCAAVDLEDWLAHHPEAWQESATMIELGPHTLVSGGGGCLSLALTNAPPITCREIAQMTLQLCGHEHTFEQDHFSAIVWQDQLEVTA